jgi:hypothetical protein
MRWATEEHEPRIVLATIKVIRRAMAGKDSMASRIGHTIEIAYMKITEAGRQALAGRAKP